jgi:hypothetical protein
MFRRTSELSESVQNSDCYCKLEGFNLMPLHFSLFVSKMGASSIQFHWILTTNGHEVNTMSGSAGGWKSRAGCSHAPRTRWKFSRMTLKTGNEQIDKEEGNQGTLGTFLWLCCSCSLRRR